ncbi:MAG: alpha/beta hydrolase [Chitinophagaceae bacterium]|nr:alpha/beta hydrolase [Chitinophagaceae bacterium]
MEKQLLLSGKKVFYRITGNGKPVLLVHGFGETGEVWNSQIDHLKDNFLLIVPDLPGSGQSDIIEDMSMEGMADTMKAIIDAESLERIDFIGHSMGGYVALAFAEKYAESLFSFGLFHSTAYADSEEKMAIRQKGIAFIREHGAFEFLKTATPNLFSPQTKAERPEIIDELVAGLNNFSPDSLVLYYQSMIKRPDRTAILKTSGVPVLFIMGEYDNAVPLKDGLTQCHLPERASIHILHHSGHMGMLEETEKSNRLLEEFLKES